MSPQEIFNKVAEHLLTQNQLAVNYEGTICYKTDTGLKCAIGCLINEVYYCYEIEHNTIKNIIKLNICPEYINYDTLDFLNVLQSIHDYHYPQYWYEKLKHTAVQFNLNLKILENFN